MENIFPREFSDLLNRNGAAILAGKEDRRPAEKIAVAHNIIKPAYVERILQAMEQRLFPLLKNYNTPVPADLIPKMKKNYSEALGKTMKMRSAELNHFNATAYKVAHDIGLTDMLASPSYKRMGEVMLGADFGRSVGKQVICYQHGDYVSPHNDHHPEDAHLKNGYFDIQLMLSNRYVRHQWLVYEQNGFLNSMADITAPSGIAVYRLPFWHYTTPMIGQPQKTDAARRWLLLHSFEYAS